MLHYCFSSDNCSGDSNTLSRLKNYLSSGDKMRKEALQHASVPCLPLNGISDEDFFCVESTGAIVTLSSSVSLIHFYCARLPSDGLVILTLYATKLFVCGDTVFILKSQNFHFKQCFCILCYYGLTLYLGFFLLAIFYVGILSLLQGVQ